ncbi:hypothetical protein [Micromonospora chersina]|uniref:hypothetical protein n=1 Tax=Micromonospora chersina TaxID=47854 RepID=UPI00367528C7
MGRIYPEFQFDAPDEHREYFHDIALAMVSRHGVSYEEAVRVISRLWGEQDHFGEYNWLIFHEDPECWADHMHRLRVDQ